MRYRILGPLRVTGDDGREIEVTAGRDRIVLAVLLLQHDRVVGGEELVDAVWGEDPPATARGQLQTCISRLRRLLPEGAIRTDPAGYAVQLGDEDLDSVVFARRAAAARLAGDPDIARRLLRAALDQWRGPALAGTTGGFVRQAALVLDEQHAVATEDWVDLELGGGRARDLIAELGALVDQFPLRERLRGQLMRALADAGRTADALAEYDRIAAALRDEVGIEPGAPLRELRQKLAPPVAEGSAPRCLPRPVSDFTGREAEVDRLLTAVRGSGPAVAVIDGMAGVGKTALAVHLAGLLGDRYPDAHLFVDLHGHSDGSPLGVADALLILLRQLGVEADRIPADLAERLTLWRSRLAERRILIVFDNAASSAQVDPMLPPGAGHLAVVTTRRRLSGLDGVRTESIEVLDEERAVALLARIVGDRVPAEPEAAARLVKRCGGLPLAIRLAGARLAHRPRWQVADLVRRLDGAGLPALAAEERSVAGVFALSYGQLPAAEQRAFTLLGVHPDPRFDAASLAALTDVSLSAAERVAETFVELHLIEEPEPGLYRLHDLMREYAALLAAGDPAGSHAAIGRVTTHYRDVLTAFADGTQNRFATDPFDRPELVEAAGDLLTWADTHRPGFGPVIAASRAAGDPYAGWRLAYATFRFCFTQGYISDLIALQTEGLAAARESGDPAAIAESLFLLAPGQMLLGRLRKAIDLMTEALALNLAERNEKLVDRVRTNLSGLLGMVGRHAEEWEMAASAAEGWWRTHEGHGWLALSNAAESAMYRGEYADALRCQQMVWAIARYVGHPVAPAVAVAQLGEIRLRMGQPRLAATLLRGGMQRKAESNYRIGLVGDVTRLAVAHRELGDLPAAIELHERALREMAELNEMRWESVVCSDYAGTKLAAGDRVGALELYRRALPPAERSELAYEQARALNGIGRCLGEPAYEERGAEILTRTGAVESGPDQLRSPGGGSRMEG